MYSHWSLLLVAIFFRSICAQITSITTTSTANYNGPLRPQVHFSPPDGFMNDPNGMFRDSDGLWHLYYQYNPTALVAGNQHWGHATSKDLYHWTNQPIALSPTESGQLVFSGSAVLDPNNTSGFFPNQRNGVVAIYTLNGDIQTQNIAYSLDGGYTFTPYASNPVLDVNSASFRDPKVIWHRPTQRWVMVVAFASDFAIGIYTSENLKEWQLQSNFSNAGLRGIEYECPNLVEIPIFNTTEGSTGPSPSSQSDETAWLLTISINPGGPLGGSTTQHFPGEFNGSHFVAFDNAVRLRDFAKDDYAAQFFYGIPGNVPQISIGWASNWQYAQVVPTASEGWRSAMSLPRLHYLTYSSKYKSYEVVSAPYDLSPVLDRSLVKSENLGNGSLVAGIGTDTVSSNAIYINITIKNASSLSKSGSVNVTLLASNTGESITLGQIPLNAVGSDFVLSRRYLQGFGRENPFVSGGFSTPVIVDKGDDAVYRMEMVFDRSLVEVFLNGGRNVGTMSVFPNGEVDAVVVKSGGIGDGVVVGAEVWGLKSTWGNQG